MIADIRNFIISLVTVNNACENQTLWSCERCRLGNSTSKPHTRTTGCRLARSKPKAKATTSSPTSATPPTTAQAPSSAQTQTTAQAPSTSSSSAQAPTTAQAQQHFKPRSSSNASAQAQTPTTRSQWLDKISRWNLTLCKVNFAEEPDITMTDTVLTELKGFLVTITKDHTHLNSTTPLWLSSTLYGPLAQGLIVDSSFLIENIVLVRQPVRYPAPMAGESMVWIMVGTLVSDWEVHNWCDATLMAGQVVPACEWLCCLYGHRASDTPIHPRSEFDDPSDVPEDKPSRPKRSGPTLTCERHLFVWNIQNCLSSSASFKPYMNAFGMLPSRTWSDYYGKVAHHRESSSLWHKSFEHARPVANGLEACRNLHCEQRWHASSTTSSPLTCSSCGANPGC